MTLKLVYAIITVLFSSNAFADNCSAELSAADNMIFDKKILSYILILLILTILSFKYFKLK